MWRLLWATVAAAGASVALAQPAKALPPLLRDGAALSPEWRFEGFPKKQAEIPPTRFEAGTVDGVAGAQGRHRPLLRHLGQRLAWPGTGATAMALAAG